MVNVRVIGKPYPLQSASYGPVVCVVVSVLGGTGVAAVPDALLVMSIDFALRIPYVGQVVEAEILDAGLLRQLPWDEASLAGKDPVNLARARLARTRAAGEAAKAACSLAERALCLARYGDVQLDDAASAGLRTLSAPTRRALAGVKITTIAELMAADHDVLRELNRPGSNAGHEAIGYLVDVHHRALES